MPARSSRAAYVHIIRTINDMSLKANTRRLTIVLIALAVAVINFVSMPAEFYPGDAYAVELEAVNLVRGGEFGFSRSDTEMIKSFLAVRDQYYIFNRDTGRYHNRWGAFNLALFAVPELANIARPRAFDGSNLDADTATIFAHNVFNCVLSVILAVLLYRLASLFTPYNSLRVFLVFSILYASFAWNYMRAQSYEIIHLTLFTGFFYYYALFLRGCHAARRVTGCRSFYLYNLFLAGLCLSKTFYFFLYPVLFFPFCAKLAASGETGGRDSLWRQRANLLRVIVPGVLTLAACLLLSRWFYGRFFLGYLQNHPHSGAAAFSPQFIPARLYDYFVSNNRSLFVHMPWLAPGLVGFYWYVRRHRYEAAFLAGAFLFCIVFFSFCYTVGEWCYGPRFFLFLLPVLCLPAAYVVEALIRSARYLALSVLAAAVLLVSAVAVHAQLEVNSRAFHLRYELEGELRRVIDEPPEFIAYFNHANFAVIARDLNTLLAGGHTGFLAEAIAAYIPEGRKEEALQIMRKYLRPKFPPNYFFWRGEMAGHTRSAG